MNMRIPHSEDASGRRTAHIRQGMAHALFFITMAACSGSEPKQEPLANGDGGVVVVEGEVSDVELAHPDLPPIAGFESCSIETASVTEVASPHLAECTPIAYPSRPGAGGPHYAVWAAWRTYDGAIPEPYLVHNLEHGGVVLLHNCPQGCPEVLQAFEKIVADFPVDPRCAPPVRARFVVAESPDLDVPVAAAAWGHVYRATCLDTAGLSEWVSAHYGRAPEDTCANGFDFATDDGKTLAPCSPDGSGSTGGPSMN